MEDGKEKDDTTITLWSVDADVTNPLHDRRKRCGEASIDVVPGGTAFTLYETRERASPEHVETVVR